MRYIRTEDGQIIDTQNTYPFLIVNYMGNDYIDFNSQGRFKIKSTSDDLTELFDTSVVDRHDGYSPYQCDPVHGIYFRNEGITVYGAIWTEWGLKYVAKMNGKGEFELL